MILYSFASNVKQHYPDIGNFVFVLLDTGDTNISLVGYDYAFLCMCIRTYILTVVNETIPNLYAHRLINEH